jgi:filamentous hemagglutinin family protein
MGSLNHSYRLVWNELCGAFVAVPEIARGRGKRSGGTVRRAMAASVLGAAAAALAGPAFALDPGALPSGAQVTAGQASMTQQGAQLRIDQATNKLVVNWNSFDIGSNASVRFNQSGADAVALNRVTGGAPSQIFGDLSANGQVWLINNSGVVFGKGATVNVGGLVASTLNVSDADFLAGRARFSGTSTAQVRNEGTIRADGVVALLGASVVNTGSISAGQVAMVAARSVSLDFGGDGLLQVQVDQAALDAELAQQGLVQGGKVVLSAPSASALRASVINMDGVVEAKGLSAQGGRIVLDGGADGQVHVTGRLDASAAQGQGGDIRVTGGDIALRGATLDASGATGGGQIHVGGGWQGKDASIANARNVTVDATSLLAANATVNGNGGEVVTWSDGRTEFAGRVESRGGDQGGNGGRIEVSGKKELAYSGRANALAAKGSTGDLLLDPDTLEISGGGSGSGALTGSIVYEKDIEAQQANVLLQAAGDIRVNDLTLNGGDGRITMKPNVSLRIEAGTAGGGDLAPPPAANDGSNAGNTDLMFANANNVLEVSGTGSLMLVAGARASGRVLNVPTMIASGAGSNPSGALPVHDVTAPGSGTPLAGSITIYGADGATVGGSLTTNGGYVRIWADSDNMGGGFFTLNAPVYTSGGNLYVSTGSGDVTLNSSMILGAGRVIFRGDGSYTTGQKILAGLLSVSGDVNIDTPFVFKGGASIYTDSSINFGNVPVNLDTGTGVLTLRANHIDWGTATLQNLSTASLHLEPFDPATNMILGDANGFASAATLAKLPGIKNLTVGRADGTGTISVPGNFSFSASGSFEMVDRNIDISAGTLTNTSGNIVLTGDNVNLSQAVTANGGAGKVTIRQMTAANALHLGGGLSNASIGQVNAASLEIGRADGGDLVFDSDISTNASTVHLKSGGQVLGVNGGVAAAKVAVTAGQGATLTDDTFNFTTLALDTGGTTLIRPSSAAGYTIGTVDTLNGLTLRNGANVTVDAGTGALTLGAPVNFTGTAATLTLQAPTWARAGTPAMSNGAQATVVFQATGAGAATTVGGASADLSSGLLTMFNGVDTLRVDASDRALNVNAPVAVSVGGLELLGGTFTQGGSIGVTGGDLLVRAGAGGINVAQAMSATGTVSLDERGGAGISGSAAITANALALRSTGAAALTANQHVNQIAADVGSLSLVADRSLTVGTVDGLSGVHATGTVQLTALGASSDLTLQQAVSADDAGGQARGVTLVAGRNFINQAGASAVQVGHGGHWQVYSTSPLNDTRGGLVADFKQYDAGYGATVLGTGNGFLYTVAPTLTVSLSGSTSKVYDGNTNAAVDAGMLQTGGAIDGDVVHVGIGGSGGARYDTKNVGTGKTVTVDGLVVTDGANGGTAVYGYRLASDSASAAIGTVTPKTVTVAVGAVQDKVYDGTTSAQFSSGGIAGLVRGDDTALTGSVRFLDKNAGTGKAVDVSGLGLSGADAANYVLDTRGGATAAITPKTVDVGAITVTGKVYDGTRTAQVSTGGAIGVVAGDQLGVKVSGQYDDKNAGTGKAVDVALALTGADAGNYQLASGTKHATGDITTRTIQAPSVSVVDATYSGDATATLVVGAPRGVLAGDQVSVSGTGRFDTPYVGTDKSVAVQLQLQGADALNYRLEPSTLTVTGAVNALTKPPVDGLVVQPVGGNGTQGGGDGNGGSKTANVPTGNGGSGGGTGTTVASVAAGPSGNPNGTVGLGDPGTGAGAGGNANGGLGGNGNAGGGNGGLSGNGNGAAGNGVNGAGANGGDVNGNAGGLGNGAAGANGNGATGHGLGGIDGGAAGNGSGNGANANGAGGTAGASGDSAGQGNGGNGIALATLSLEQTLRDGGQVSLAVEAPAYDQARQSQLPVYADKGEPTLLPLGMFRVDDLGDSLALKPLQQPVPATERTATGVTRQVRAAVTLEDGQSAMLNVVLMADGTLRVQAPESADALSDDLIAALALSALKQQTGVAPTSVRAVMLRRG